jgi:nitrite reductase/ring-hydroxylating ferredoxin subunit
MLRRPLILGLFMAVISKRKFHRFIAPAGARSPLRDRRIYRKIAPPHGRHGDSSPFQPAGRAGCFRTPEEANSHFRAGLKPAGREWAAGNRPAVKGRQMAEKFVAKSSEFLDGDRRIVFVGDHEIGVFRHEGQFYAYSNFCLHQGGPACEGLTIAKVEERLRPDKTSQGLYFSETEMHFVCPWHGMEYDMKTGECVSDRKMKLRSYKVLQKGDEVYVVA